MPLSLPTITTPSAKTLASAGREALIETLDGTRQVTNEWIRRMVLQHNRIDILAEQVLGYTVAPGVHRRIMVHQFQHPRSLVLVYRGAGKTTTGTIAKAIHYILKDSNVCILIASKIAKTAEDILKEIKMQFETNERLIEIFGNYVGEYTWETKSIEVRGRTKPAKEPTIMTVGVEGAVAGKHYHVIMADDLVDEENSRTEYQRQKMVDWYYKMLAPTLRPPGLKGHPHSGEFHHLGTRYHPFDLYNQLMEIQSDGSGGSLAGHTLIIPALDAAGNSPWPERHPPEWFVEKRREYGIIRFNSQYQCNAESMKGKMFRIDDMQILREEGPGAEAFPVKAPHYIGIDLAIGEEEQHDMFAMVCLAKTDRGWFCRDFFEGQLRFNEQTQKIMEWARRYKPVRAGIEVNAYQAAQFQEVRRRMPELNLIPITTLKDKVTRGWNLTKHFENRRVWFRAGQHKLVEHLILFPDFRYKDLFDAFDLAVTVSERRAKRGRTTEPGIL